MPPKARIRYICDKFHKDKHDVGSLMGIVVMTSINDSETRTYDKK
jgi:hypothetical protein